jgi:hypothetical protein
MIDPMAGYHLSSFQLWRRFVLLEAGLDGWALFCSNCWTRTSCIHGYSRGVPRWSLSVLLSTVWYSVAGMYLWQSRPWCFLAWQLCEDSLISPMVSWIWARACNSALPSMTCTTVSRLWFLCDHMALFNVWSSYMTCPFSLVLNLLIHGTRPSG